MSRPIIRSIFRGLSPAFALLFVASVPDLPAVADTALPASVAGRELVVGTKVAPPFVFKDNSGTWEGLSIELWRHTADRLGWRYRFQEATLPDLISKTSRGDMDVAIAAITVTAERETAVDFSQPYYSTGLGIAVLKTGSATFGVMRGVLSLNLLRAMAGVIAVLVVVGLIVWLLERRHNEQFGDHKRGLQSSIMWAAMTAAGSSGDATPKTFVGQLIWIGWLLTSVLVISSLTAVLTSALTMSRLQSQVAGVDDLRRLRAATVSDSAPKAYLDRQGIAAATFPSLGLALEALESGKVDAVVYDRPLLVWTVRETFPTTLSVLDITFNRQTYAIALPPDSPLRVHLNAVLLEELQADWWRRALDRELGEK